MDGLRADETRELPCLAADDDALGDQRLRVEAAGGVEPEEAVVVDEADEEPDLVHVAGEHDLLALAVEAALLEGDEVAHRVDVHLVDEGLELTLADRADLVLESGRGEGFGQLLEQVHRSGLPSRWKPGW